jgi:uncharacterized membrane protein YagU involved in acid resistance
MAAVKASALGASTLAPSEMSVSLRSSGQHRADGHRVEARTWNKRGGPMKPVVIARGIVAGFVATFVLSAMMLMKHSVGLMPELDPIAMITAMAGASSPAVGWIAHFVIGSIFWGIGFALISPYLPGPYWLRGTIFAVGAWLMMMIAVMPMAGAGLFGLGLSMMAPVATLVLHVVFGLVLGGIYGLLGDKQGSIAGYSR